jgi:putative oxidoreductase
MNASGATKRASGRSGAKLAKAVIAANKALQSVLLSHIANKLLAENMASEAETPKFIPGLAWYRPFESLSYAFIRFCTGALIVPHGIDRLFHSGSHTELGGFLNSLGPSVVGTFELVGGIFLALGLLTRPIALLFAIEWIFIAITGAMGLKPGTSWLMLGATPHYPAFVAALCIAFILRGGGRYSLDWLLGKEF